jgi:hypothetical protein
MASSVETAVPFGDGNTSVRTVERTSSPILEQQQEENVSHSRRKELTAHLPFLLFYVLNLGWGYLLSYGVMHNIVWQQLMGGTCFISSLISYNGPGIPWEERKSTTNIPTTTTTTLRLIVVWLKMGAIVAGITFINVLFALLVFWTGVVDSSGSFYCVALLLVCLQMLVGRQITRVARHSWLVWCIAMAVYSFGQSALFVGLCGLCGFIAFKLPTATYAMAFMAISAVTWVPMFMIMLAWSDSSDIWNDEQVMWQGRIHVYQGKGRFRYIIHPDAGVLPAAILPEVNPYEISSCSESTLRSREQAAMMTRIRNDFLLFQVFNGIGGCIVIGSAYLWSIGVKDNIVWMQLVGGTGILSPMLSMVGPTLRVSVPWGAPARLLHQLVANLKTGVIIVGSSFINVLIVFLAFRVMDLGGGYGWCVSLVLLCLQFFTGMHIIGADYWWVRSVAVVAFIFGISALFAGYFGVMLLIFASSISRLHGINDFIAMLFIIMSVSSYILIDTMLKYCYPATQVQSGKDVFSSPEEEEACPYVKVYEGCFGNFRYRDPNGPGRIYITRL